MDNIIKLGIGEIPLDKLCSWLNHRNYTKEMVIEYIKKYYDMDVREDIETLHKNHKILFDLGGNTYEEFENKHKPTKVDDGTRKWFNYYGRKRYLKFLEEYMLFSCDFEDTFDEILDKECYTEIHHILPLTHGGTNKLTNLISINSFFHVLLGENPLIHIEKYAYQSLDYLWYLIRCRQDYMNEKYKYNTHKDTPKLLAKLFEESLAIEMRDFYNLITMSYENETQHIL